MVLNTISEGGFMSYMTFPSCKKMNVFGACLRQGGLSFFWVFNKLNDFELYFQLVTDLPRDKPVTS